MAKTTKQYQDEIRTLAEQAINAGGAIDNALVVGSHEYAIVVDHPELGQCSVVMKTVVKPYKDTDKVDRFDAAEEAEAYARECEIKAKAAEEKKAAAAKKKKKDEEARAARKSAKSKKTEETKPAEVDNSDEEVID